MLTAHLRFIDSIIISPRQCPECHQKVIAFYSIADKLLGCRQASLNLAGGQRGERCSRLDRVVAETGELHCELQPRARAGASPNVVHGRSCFHPVPALQYPIRPHCPSDRRTARRVFGVRRVGRLRHPGGEGGTHRAQSWTARNSAVAICDHGVARSSRSRRTERT
jgi:hypothetical protein